MDLMRFPELPEVLVSSEQWSPRLEAALEWTLSAVLGLRWRRMEGAELETTDAPWKLRYGGDPIGPGHWLEPEGLLSSEEIRKRPPEASGGDWLSLIFWMGSRMEEWADGARRDEHGRFDPEGCASVERGWTTAPVCEEWAFEVGRGVMGSDWPEHEARLRSEHRFETTLDIDSAFAFVGKGGWRTGAALARDVLTGSWGTGARRISACMGRSADPYDTYAQAAEWHRDRGLVPKWFFLLARFGAHDKGLPPDSPRLAALMRSLEEEHPGSVQWHPGYAAAEDFGAMEQEHATFTAIMGRRPEAARQHYLRMVPGVTRRRLIDLGIREDHTEGHAALVGFRGGFSRSRRWYDLEREELTPLELHPFMAMDATLRAYMDVPADAVPAKLEDLTRATRRTGGPARILWHNESLSSEGMWRGWAPVYPNVLKVLSAQGREGLPLD